MNTATFPSFWEVVLEKFYSNPSDLPEIRGGRQRVAYMIVVSAEPLTDKITSFRQDRRHVLAAHKKKMKNSLPQPPYVYPISPNRKMRRKVRVLESRFSRWSCL
jgi:hypothetical protein